MNNIKIKKVSEKSVLTAIYAGIGQRCKIKPLYLGPLQSAWAGGPGDLYSLFHCFFRQLQYPSYKPPKIDFMVR